jgi:hypothetical protein
MANKRKEIKISREIDSNKVKKEEEKKETNKQRG